MPNSVSTYLWLCFAAFLAGVMNSVAGGGTLLTFPALTEILNPTFGAAGAVLANATSTVALVPGSVAAAWGFRREMADTRQWLLILGIPSLLGGLIGTLLVTEFDPRYFAALVPWLLLLAAVLFLLQPTLSRFLRHDKQAERLGPSRGTVVAVVIFQFLVAVYGGYFGAGIGILMLSSLGLMGLADIHRMNALKTFLAGCINGVSVAIFIMKDKVVWNYALYMAVAAIIGGYTGARVSRRLNRVVVRWIVITIGFGLAAYYFIKQMSSAPT